MKKSVVLNLKNDILQESPYCEHDWTWYKKIWVRKLIRRENLWLPFSQKSPWKFDRPSVRPTLQNGGPKFTSLYLHHVDISLSDFLW